MDDENLPPLRQREIQHERKIAKPLMEKRRRERINNCLDQLKSLLIEVTKKDDDEENNSYRSKLEKADILEMTVNYLKTVKRQKMSGNILQASTELSSSIQSKYVAGFRECAKEVASYLGKIEGLTAVTHSTLMQHLTSHLQQNETAPPRKDDHLRTLLTQSYTKPSTLAESTPPLSNNHSDLPPPSTMMSYPVQLIPAMLATGEAVYVLANTSSHSGAKQCQPLNIETTNRPSSIHTDHRTQNYEAISPVKSPENNVQVTITDREGLICESARNVFNTKTIRPTTFGSASDIQCNWPLQTESRGGQQNQTTALDNQYLISQIRMPSTASAVMGDHSNMWRPW